MDLTYLQASAPRLPVRVLIGHCTATRLPVRVLIGHCTAYRTLARVLVEHSARAFASREPDGALVRAVVRDVRSPQ